jgi:DNA-binding response OmpR family regulator
MAKLLLVEDDGNLRDAVADFLSFEHHQVETAKNCRDAKDKLFVSGFDLLILDWELPDGSGIEIIREFRAQGGDAPVLMLTGKNTINDKETGFNSGADDYLTKPFNLKEVGMRVNALLRRPRATATADNALKVRNIVLEPASYRVLKDGKDVMLLPTEFALLQFLMRNQNKVFSAEALLERVWQSESEASTKAVSACIHRLRGKLESDGELPLIKTVHGVGYKLEP